MFIDRSAWRRAAVHAPLSKSAKTLAFVLDTTSEGSDKIAVTLGQLEKLCASSQVTVIRAIGELEDAGFLVCERAQVRRIRNNYWLTMPQQQGSAA